MAVLRSVCVFILEQKRQTDRQTEKTDIDR